MTCPVHHVRLEFDETVEQSRMVGGLSWQSEESRTVARYVCPVAGCRQAVER